MDGAFWHGYDWENRKQSIKSNREFWIAKIERNMQRDQEVNSYYQSKGWTIMRFWDFEVKGSWEPVSKGYWINWKFFVDLDNAVSILINLIWATTEQQGNNTRATS